MRSPRRGQQAGLSPEDTAIDDLELVEQFRAGDMRAFDALLARYENRIYNFSYRMVGDAQNARDLTQDIFLRAFRYLNNFRGDGKFSTWLFTIASSTCKNALAYYSIREKYAQRDFYDPEGEGGRESLQLVPDFTNAPEPAAMRSATAEALRQALARIPENYRKMIVLRDVNDFSYEEIARITGVSLGTVKSRIARGRLLLREKLIGLGCFGPE